MNRILLLGALAGILAGPARAADLCDGPCSISMSFPAGGTITTTNGATLTFGSGGSLDLAGGSITEGTGGSVTPAGGDMSAGGSVVLGTGGSIDFGAGGSLDTGGDGGFSVLDASSLEVDGPSTVDVQSASSVHLGTMDSAGTVYYTANTVTGADATTPINFTMAAGDASTTAQVTSASDITFSQVNASTDPPGSASGIGISTTNSPNYDAGTSVLNAAAAGQNASGALAPGFLLLGLLAGLARRHR